MHGVDLTHSYKLGVDKLALQAIADLAISAGDAIMQYYHGEKGLGIQQKSDDSPVTLADLASHGVIVEGLKQLTPNIPIMSEEAPNISWSERQSWTVYWLIDPLDGTKEFIGQNGEFTVNIALIVNGQAVAGVVYAPVLGKCYCGSLGQGAWCIDDHQNTPFSLTATAKVKRSKPIVVGSRSHPSPELGQYLDSLPAYELLSVGSSLKFCMLAEGKADLYPRLGPTSEWDTAAAQAVLEAAGGKVSCYPKRQPLRYNTKEEILNPYFIATSADYS